MRNAKIEHWDGRKNYLGTVVLKIWSTSLWFESLFGCITLPANLTSNHIEVHISLELAHIHSSYGVVITMLAKSRTPSPSYSLDLATVSQAKFAIASYMKNPNEMVIGCHVIPRKRNKASSTNNSFQGRSIELFFLSDFQTFLHNRLDHIVDSFVESFQLAVFGRVIIGEKPFRLHSYHA